MEFAKKGVRDVRTSSSRARQKRGPMERPIPICRKTLIELALAAMFSGVYVDVVPVVVEIHLCTKLVRILISVHGSPTTTRPSWL